MENNEIVQDYLARVYVIVSQMRSYGENIVDEVLRSLIPNIDHVVHAIEESKYLSKFSLDHPHNQFWSIYKYSGKSISCYHSTRYKDLRQWCLRGNSSRSQYVGWTSKGIKK